MNSPDSTIHLFSLPTNASSFIGITNFTRLFSFGFNLIFSKPLSRFTLGVILATRSEQNACTTSLPSMSELFVRVTIILMVSYLEYEFLSNLRSEYLKLE